MKNSCLGALSALGLLVFGSAAQAGSSYVVSVEQKLAQLGYHPGPVDGLFDSEMKAAIRRFQQDKGLPADGLLSRETYEAIVDARLPAPTEANPVNVAPVRAPIARPVIAQQVEATPPQPAVQEAPMPAAKPVKVLSFLLEAAAEFGGDTIATVYYTDGSSSSIKAGRGLLLAGGLAVNVSPAFDLRFTGGYKVSVTQDKNSDAGFERFVFKTTGNYLTPTGLRLGGGLAYHTGIKLDAGGLGDNVKFKPAVGLVVEGGWKWFALTYTAIDYKTKQQEKAAASNIGLNVNYKF